VDGLSNLSKRKLGRRDATGFKKLPHPDDFVLWQIAMSVRECSGTSIEHHTDSIAGLIVHLCPQVFQDAESDGRRTRIPTEGGQQSDNCGQRVRAA
jgi:hypothetical protein